MKIEIGLFVYNLQMISELAREILGAGGGGTSILAMKGTRNLLQTWN